MVAIRLIDFHHGCFTFGIGFVGIIGRYLKAGDLRFPRAALCGIVDEELAVLFIVWMKSKS